MSNKARALLAVVLIVAILTAAASALETGTTNVYLRIDDGESTEITTNAGTVGDFLNEQGIFLGEFDTVKPDAAETIAGDGTEITVLRGVNVTITVDGESFSQKQIKTEQMMLSRFIAKYSAQTDAEYEYDMSLWSAPLYDGMNVDLRTKKTETFTTVAEEPFLTRYVEAPDIYTGDTIVLVAGIPGELSTTTNVVFVSDTEVSREIIKETVTTEPTSEVVLIGTAMRQKSLNEITAEENKQEEIRLERLEAERLEAARKEAERLEAEKKEAARKEAERKAQASAAQSKVEREVLNKSKASEVANFNYSKELVMSATAYTADYESTGKNPGDKGFGITASGMKARVGVVAVDPRVIPLGTQLYIEGYGYAVAGDTGSAIKGNKIDLYFDTNWECKVFGRQNLRVYVLN